MEIKHDNLEGGAVIRLLEEHMQDMLATSPPESVHALDVHALKHPSVIFYSSWQGDELLGCVALKKLDDKQVELKSMRTTDTCRNKGVASKLLEHVIKVAKEQGYQTISLETGSMAFFKPARALYKKYGFEYCSPFSDYQLDPNSCFMSRGV